jgi:AcrR family transcriptional regulator
MLGAMAEAVAEKGYARVAVADVIERAGVSRKTFYEHVANKDECFLVAYDAGVDALMGEIEEAVAAAAPDWLAAASAGAQAYLDALAANPAFARTYLVEISAAGPDALERRTAVHERFAAQLADTHRSARADLPELPDLPDYAFRACVGAINELVTDHLLRHGADGLGGLVGALLDVEVALLVGRELAARIAAS